ncbi:MAG: hypothetical protein COX62_03355 [Deltaproteobacteria bacterium CG_4_10_14_0_2_um_filter_43_8]|nr:MAG: hypothetical protein COV43_08435 [Deltaproteobacteria bacterium CG11_big_fil_rev_8_21_14_0_20_42_23]PJA21089.1 MAG: hypothetical protein COX62_03355 [Deltaproteobacteria bacterium CG_4_10_14_0_2_um_filter_43_8]PJC63701.1 MAG: hypothetical protein CO021_08185 [Deltaproteobacteria bacterium CG_4_9_14_0_2_um_filter_42_21]
MMKKYSFIFCALLFLFSCTQGQEKRAGSGVSPDEVSTPNTSLSITDESELITGPLAISRVGDVLLQNDKIKVVIQKPGKDTGLGSFGGSIIDAVPLGSKSGDHFGEIFPLVNVEWTVNYYKYKVIEDGDRKVLRAFGRIDVYDYLDIDFVASAADALVGQKLGYAHRFDDRSDPFDIYDDLKGLDTEVVTDYILPAGKKYVIMKTTYKNNGKQAVKLPLGEFVNGSGSLSELIPGLGYSPDLTAQIGGHTPALIYSGMDGIDVSYGYFYDPAPFIDPKTKEMRSTASLSYSGLTAVLFGEEFLKIFPLGSSTPPDIHFSLSAGEEKTLTRYFVVGDGSAGSVLDAGLEALGVKTNPIQGKVVDANGNAVENATVAIKNKGGATVVTYRSDSNGSFSGLLPTGEDALSKSFGKGQYTVEVYKEGFHLNGSSSSGECTPSDLDLKLFAKVECVLGESSSIVFSNAITDGRSPLVARLTIVGEDPSPNVSNGKGVFYDNDLLSRPFGIVDIKYITAKGTIALSNENSFQLEPGTYRFIFSHGPEYDIHDEQITLAAGETHEFSDIVLKRLIATPNYISSDFHVHGIHSPDSAFTEERRVLSAAAEGLDILQSSDHDYLTDYNRAYRALIASGEVAANSMQTAVGDEITPNQYGHLHAFPLEHHAEDVAGGALDWSYSPRDEISTSPDYAMTVDEIIEAVRKDPGEEVLQINHIMDSPSGLLVAAGWVTSPFYRESFSVDPLTTYANPVERRLPAVGVASAYPFPFSGNGLISNKFNAIELEVGGNINNLQSFYRSALPSWFNLLNVGMLLTATADSDSHSEKNPLGLPRNYILSSVDPKDDGKQYENIDLEEYAFNINEGRVIVSAGPYISMKVMSEDGNEYHVGDTAKGKQVEIEIEVQSPSWAWFDTVEIYANTEPVPVDDETGTPFEGVAADPADFYQPYRVPQYSYRPTKSFRVIDQSLESWKEADGVITASVRTSLTVTEDTWFVVLVRGTKETEGYRSLFPVLPQALLDDEKSVNDLDPLDLEAVYQHENVGASAWALTNPVYIDLEGDGFEAKYQHLRSPF